MKIVVFGADGQVGKEIEAAASGEIDIVALRRADADLSAPGGADAAIRTFRPDAVINAAAWTGVDKAESEPQAAFQINAEAVGEIAGACASVGARLVHISTDYVFSGRAGDRPLRECDEAGPINIYGASKLKGEELALSSGADAVIVRTSWVYSVHGSNFVKTMLRLAGERDEIRVVNDQFGGPTPASAIARACLEIAKFAGQPGGVYHFQGAPAASWADFASAIIAAAGKSTRIVGIPTTEYAAPAARPLRTILDCSKIQRDYGLVQPDWREDVRSVVKRLTG